MAPVSLKNVTVSKIKPYTKTEHPAIVKPAFFDLMGLDVYKPIVFFYKSEEGQEASSFIDLVEQIKESLSKVLVPYFPMAGRWVKTYDARIRELECNDEGVTFIEAFIDEKLESVVKLNDFESVDLLSGFHVLGLDSKAFNQVVETPLPSLFVQVTQFKCGSVSLGVTISHMTADGNGMFAFMEAWSEMALHGQTSIVPSHDRSLTISMAQFMRFAAGDSGTGDVVEPENVSTEKVDTNSKRADPGLALIVPREITNNKTLHVRRQVIEDLKREAALQNMTVTTLDLISTHFWRSINRFPKSLDGKTSSVLATVVDGRSRFHDPPLPERYFGNVITTASTPPLYASDLAAGSSPIIAANIVHNSIREINPSSWKHFLLTLMQQTRDSKNSGYRMLIISSWLRYPMYEISFGCGFGKPILATANWTLGTIPTGLGVVQPPPPALAEAAIASVQLLLTSDEAAKTLYSDEQFQSFFLPFESIS